MSEISEIAQSNKILTLDNNITFHTIVHRFFQAFGYQKHDAFSLIAFIWLKYMSVKNNIQIKHSSNGGGKRIDNYKLDGWNEESLTAYEFHGCVFHGCPKCFNNTTFNALKNDPINQTYLKHMRRINQIKTKVSCLIEIFEYDFDLLVETDELM
jgi:hypothetical protein